MKPDESVTLDFIGIGFQAGVEAALAEFKRQKPRTKVDIDPDALRAEWAEKNWETAEILSFNNARDGAFTITHAWAFRVFAHHFLEYMERVGAENFIRQEIEIVPKLTSGLQSIVIEVSTGKWHTKKRIKKKGQLAALKDENAKLKGALQELWDHLGIRDQNYVLPPLEERIKVLLQVD